MFAAILALSIAPLPPAGNLPDAYSFGASYEESHAIRIFAYQHRANESIKAELQTWNSYAVYWQWERETEWRYRCWDALEDALNPGAADDFRLRRLSALRALLGEEAYLARCMPSPIPSYRGMWD